MQSVLRRTDFVYGEFLPEEHDQKDICTLSQIEPAICSRVCALQCKALNCSSGLAWACLLYTSDAADE